MSNVVPLFPRASAPRRHSEHFAKSTFVFPEPRRARAITTHYKAVPRDMS
jgi:hypothetical protein